MKYYIDFEATQYSNEIISVGCVDENGREFYSLVRPHRRGKLTDFITELTGITKEDLASAPGADEVFENFLDWVDKSEKAEFFCYGDNDEIFIRYTMRHITSFKAQTALSLIRANLNNFAKKVKEHFLINQSIALIKIVSYYRKEEVVQCHNSLDDARFLKEIAEHMEHETVDICPFPEYQRRKARPEDANTLRDAKRIIIASKGEEKLNFPSYRTAAAWLLDTYVPKGNTITERTKGNISNKIVRAARRKEPYFGFLWAVKDNRSEQQENS